MANPDRVQLMESKIDHFLAKHRDFFQAGSPVSNAQIEKYLKVLGKDDTKKNLSISSFPEEYVKFLNKYGSISGKYLEICGRGPDDAPDGEIGCQRSFRSVCTGIYRMKAAQVRRCWLIAQIMEADHYFMCFSKKGKGYVYSLDSNGRVKFYAKSFLDFLDRFFEEYEVWWLNRFTSQDEFTENYFFDRRVNK